jgi:hypothetical protein
MLGRFSTERRQVLIAAVAPIGDAIRCSSSGHPAEFLRVVWGW